MAKGSWLGTQVLKIVVIAVVAVAGIFIVACHRQPASGKFVLLRAHQLEVVAVAFSPDGKYLLSGSTDRTVKLWSVGTWSNVRTEVYPDGVTSIAIDDKTGLYAIGLIDGRLEIRDIGTGAAIAAVSFDRGIRAMAWHPSGEQIAIAAGGSIVVFDLPSRHIRTVSDAGSNGSGGIWALSISPDGVMLAGGEKRPAARFAESHAVSLWRIDTATEEATVDLSGGIDSIAFSPDGRLLVVGARDGYVTALSAEELHTVFRVRTSPNRLSRWPIALAFSPNGRQLAIACDTILVIDVETQVNVVLYTTTGSSTHDVAWSPDGRFLVTAEGHGFVRVCDIGGHSD